MRDTGGEIEVTVERETGVYRAGQVVLAGDAWTNDLLRSFDRRLPLTITQEQVTYFTSGDRGAFAPERFPIWIWQDETSFYGLPAYGGAGPKAGQDVGGKETTATTRTFDTDDAALRRVREFLATYLPTHLGPEIYTKTCLYTLTPDRDFLVDRLTDHPGVLVVLGAAHAYKYASVLGRILAELIVDGSTPSQADIEGFRIDRAILLEANPVTSFMV
jgi:sarcosine oxidase